jgi:F-type H+-transporting ATPase subunit a
MAPEPIDLYAIRQFEIKTLFDINVFGYHLAFTNSALTMLVTLVLAATYFAFATKDGKTIPGRMQASAEFIYVFVEDTLMRYGGKEAKQTLPFFMTVFVFILFGSLLGLIPVKFPFTSHLIVTFALALLVFIYVTALGFKTQGLGFFRFFLPTGTPLAVAPLMIVIEVVSYLFRPVTMGLRLFANILSGHLMLKLFGDFIVMMIDSLGALGVAASILPLAGMVLMYFAEVSVVLIQSYVFIVLSAIYVKDALHSH